MIKEIYYQCEKCGQKYDYKPAGHSIKIKVKGKDMLQACHREIKKIVVTDEN